MPQFPTHPFPSRTGMFCKTKFVEIKVVSVCLAIVLLLAGAISTWAQSTSGDIVGTVSDKNGAAISGADVSAKNTATGVVTAVKAGTEGIFHIPNLPAGVYDITGTAPGFAPYVLKGFTV